MNRADKMLQVLRDGRPHTREEIFWRVGGFFLTNNAASELRAKGHNVEHHRQKGVDIYRLVALDEAAAIGTVPAASSSTPSIPASSLQGADTTPQAADATGSQGGGVLTLFGDAA